MGTTCTAAYVGESEVTIAHVGDSRAYLWRNGELTRLTRDHSLVGELVARGKLTEEQAEAHPQRSVITRALGPEAEVQVDVEVFDARDGDVYLLCSDGLTSMIHEPGVKPVLERMTSLEQTGRDLIAAANDAGGRDNITVILFRLEEVSGGAGGGSDGAQQTAAHHDDSGATTEYDTFEGEAVPAPRQGVSRPTAHTRVRDEEAMHAGEVAHAVRAADDAEASYRASGTVALSAIKPRAETQEAPERTVSLPDGTPPRGGRPVERKKRRRRIPLGVLIPLVLLFMVASAFWTASRAVYFVGADEDRGNVVTIYRGLPIDLPFGAKLYSRYAGSGVTLESVPPARRGTFTNHKLRSKDDAENLVIQLERGQLDS
jgi:protein phosphatase